LEVYQFEIRAAKSLFCARNGLQHAGIYQPMSVIDAPP
jgi:hypothetical protein